MQHELNALGERLVSKTHGGGSPDKKMTESAHEEALWSKYSRDEEQGIEPNVFKHLSLASDGGFTEVKGLYACSRWISAAVLLIFVVYNIEALVVQDLAFAMNPKQAVQQLSASTDKAVIQASTDSVLDSFYFSEGVSDWVWMKLGNTDKLESVRVLGFVELLGVMYFLFSITVCLLRAAFSDGFKKWFGIQNLCWDIMPTLSSYSAMKLLNCIVPAVLCRDLLDVIAVITEAVAEKNDINDKTGKKKGICPIICGVISLIVWAVKLVVFFVIGFDTFLMKLRVVSGLANSKSGMIPCIQFLVQVLGVVQLGPFVRNRLFLFIFGGEDGILQQEEKELMETWNALLARRMYKDLWESDGTTNEQGQKNPGSF